MTIRTAKVETALICDIVELRIFNRFFPGR
jgi:hypothetical protein